MKRTLSLCIVLAFGCLTFLPAAQAHVLNPPGFGNWVVTSTGADEAAPHFDAMYQRDTYNNIRVNWLYKTKFFEVGERWNMTSNQIQWTRFDFGPGAVQDSAVTLAFNGHNYFPSVNPTQCAAIFESVYNGVYTQLNGANQPIRFTERFYYWLGTCSGDPIDNFAYEGRAESLDPTDTFYWRIVTVQDADLGNINCLTTSYMDYNSANNGNWVTIEENSVAPTPGNGPNPDVRLEANTNPLHQLFYSMPDVNLGGGVVQASDLVGTFNIALDMTWFFDRRLAEIVHDATASENWGNIADTTCAHTVTMFEYQTQVFYNTPFFFGTLYLLHDLNGL